MGGQPARPQGNRARSIDRVAEFRVGSDSDYFVLGVAIGRGGVGNTHVLNRTVRQMVANGSG